MDQQRIVLVSASPRRKELLRQIGLDFVVDPGGYEEELPRRSPSPHGLARRLSLEKARHAAGRHTKALLIAADTIVALDGRILGKPGSPPAAGRMLKALSGRAHLVVTGFTILDTGSGKSRTGSVETTVYLKKLSLEEINAYVGSGEPLDKAGAYGIQGLGAVIVDRIEGDYFNVVGLPLSALAGALKEFGVEVLGVE
ncbi:MAG: septum formation protein Maf [Chloroflexi bacterium]|nr:septum formation protein Maf [Chloroflexota bacterium]